MCTACRRATTRKRRRPIDVPPGFELRARPVGDATAYRGSATGVGYVVSRAWWRRWGVPGVFMIVWGGGLVLWGLAAAILPFFGGHPAHDVVPTLVIGLAALGVGVPALRMAIANLTNRTFVHVDHGAIERHDGPIRWSKPLHIARDPGDRIEVQPVAKNDLRNAAGRWPAPRTYEVVVAGARREPVVLFEQIWSEGEARAVRALVRAALRATS